MSEVVILRTPSISVRIMILEPEDKKPWHFHSEVTDIMYCLSGKIKIKLGDSKEERLLKPGEQIEIQAGRMHKVLNESQSESRYLLVQHGGVYDFNVVSETFEG